MKLRFIEEIGIRTYLRIYWGEDCLNSYGYNHKGCHNTQVFLKDYYEIDNWDVGGKTTDYPEDMWPIKCDHCGAEVPVKAHYQIFKQRLYNNESGKPEPGDIYWCGFKHQPDFKKYYCSWDNCNDPRGHLIVILPNGNEWDLDSRASNCTMKEDKIHRCWVRHGEVPDIHVDKEGHTCQAGAGSIIHGDYHGFLHNGELIKL